MWYCQTIESTAVIQKRRSHCARHRSPKPGGSKFSTFNQQPSKHIRIRVNSCSFVVVGNSSHFPSVLIAARNCFSASAVQ